MSAFKFSFEAYLIMIGIRNTDSYLYTEKSLFDNIEYFRKCYDDNLSAYKALLFFQNYLKEKHHAKSI